MKSNINQKLSIKNYIETKTQKIENSESTLLEEVKKLKEFFNNKENKIEEVHKVIIDYDPNNLGAYIRSDGNKSEPTVMIPFNKLDILEPESKMEKDESSKKLKELVKLLKQGKKLEPILVRRVNGRYQILDGHHRYAAYKEMDIKNIPARIVSPSNVKIHKNDSKKN
jgi:hypothetical protein